MGLSIPALLAKIKKMKTSMTMANKKYFSFKIIYQKLLYFFSMRASEVEFVENSQFRHPLTLEEHFFKYLTEKESSQKKIEEKIKNFIVTILSMEPNPKIEVFKRFISMSSDFPY